MVGALLTPPEHVSGPWSRLRPSITRGSALVSTGDFTPGPRDFAGIVVQLPLPIRSVLRPVGGKKGVSPPYYIRVKLRLASFEALVPDPLLIRSSDPDELHPHPLVVLTQGGLQLIEELLHAVFVRVIDEVINDRLVGLL